MHQADELAPPEAAANGESPAKDSKEASEKWKQRDIVKICTVELGFNGETDEQGKLIPKVSLYREDFGDGPTHRFDEYNKWVGWIAEEADWPVPEIVSAKGTSPENLIHFPFEFTGTSIVGSSTEKECAISLSGIGIESPVGPDDLTVTIDNPAVSFPEGDAYNARISFRVTGQDADEFVENKSLFYNLALYYYLEGLRIEYQNQREELEAERTLRIAAESAVETAVPPLPEETKIEIRDVDLSEVGPSSGTPEKRLMAKVNFQLSGAEAQTLTAERLPYRVEVHAIDLESKNSILVASARNELQPQIFEYTSQQKFPLPEVGRYELHSIVLLLPPGAMVAHHQGPTINIVP
jgi:hypothetical protein